MNFAVNWLETNYIVNFAENSIEEWTGWDVADRPQTLFGQALVRRCPKTGMRNRPLE